MMSGTGGRINVSATVVCACAGSCAGVEASSGLYVRAFLLERQEKPPVNTAHIKVILIRICFILSEIV